MSKNLKELAQMIKGNDNPNNIGITIGEVISTSPYRIQYGDKIILESRHLYFAGSLINGYTGEYTDDNGTTTLTKEVMVRNSLKIGDKVILIPDNNLKKWFVLDKVVKL